jgi:hypothetical protein
MARRNCTFFNTRAFPIYFFLIPFVFFINPVYAKDVIGKIEMVGINNADFSLRAKIDTGAKNSSLNASNYHLSMRGEEKWIRFDVTNQLGKSITLEKQIIRFVKIKRKEATTQQRPAILLDICIGKVSKQVEVNLINRSNFDFQMLIGRSFLRGDFIVDVEKSYTADPRCQ